MRPEHSGRFERILGEVCNAISFTLIGNIVISVIAGTFAGVAAAIVGVPSPMVLALIVGCSTSSRRSGRRSPPSS